MTNNVKQYKPGQSRLSARGLNQIVRSINDKDSPKTPKQDRERQSPTQLTRFKITQINNDYLTCQQLNADGNPSKVGTTNIAKPYLLTQKILLRNGIAYSAYSGQSRTATSGGDSENQTIVPSYVIGDEIKAFRAIGGTGVTDSSNKPVNWEDNNNDGRAWAEII